MIRRRGLKSLVLAGTCGAALVLGQPPVLAAPPLLDYTVGGPISGAQLVVAGQPLPPVSGLRNVRILITSPTGGPPPQVTQGSHPGCTGFINLAFFLTYPSVNAGDVTVFVTFENTDAHGNPVSSGSIGGERVPAGHVVGQTIQVFGLCANPAVPPV